MTTGTKPLTLASLVEFVDEHEHLIGATDDAVAGLRSAVDALLEIGQSDLGASAVLDAARRQRVRLVEESAIASAWLSYGCARIDALARAYVDEVLAMGMATASPELVVLAGFVGGPDVCPFDLLTIDEANFMDEMLPVLGTSTERTQAAHRSQKLVRRVA